MQAEALRKSEKLCDRYTNECYLDKLTTYLKSEFEILPKKHIKPNEVIINSSKTTLKNSFLPVCSVCSSSILGPFGTTWYPNQRVTKIGTLWLFGTLWYPFHSGNANSTQWKRGFTVPLVTNSTSCHCTTPNFAADSSTLVNFLFPTDSQCNQITVNIDFEFSLHTLLTFLLWRSNTSLYLIILFSSQAFQSGYILNFVQLFLHCFFMFLKALQPISRIKCLKHTTQVSFVL